MELFIGIACRDGGIAVNRDHAVQKDRFTIEVFDYRGNLMFPAAHDASIRRVGRWPGSTRVEDSMLTQDDWQRVIDVNLNGLYNVLHPVGGAVDHGHTPVDIFTQRYVPGFAGGIAGTGKFSGK